MSPLVGSVAPQQKKENDLQRKDAELNAKLEGIVARLNAAYTAIITRKADFAAIPALIAVKIEGLTDKMSRD